ncbi:MAG: ASPIC/UnbV domain-containing protein [Pseudomonadota bacterium]
MDVFAVVERPFRNASVAQTPWVAALFLDRGASGGALVLDLVGPMENPDAVGARVRLTVDGRTRLLSPLAQETSRRSSGNREIVAGLGDATRADRIEVIWPDGARSAAEGVAAGAYEWRQGDPAPTPRVGACRG